LLPLPEAELFNFEYGTAEVKEFRDFGIIGLKDYCLKILVP